MTKWMKFKRSTTRQGTYYGAQVEGKIKSECRGPEYRGGDGHHSRRGSRSSSNSSDSAKSGWGRSLNRGSPVHGNRKSRRIDSSEAIGVKKVLWFGPVPKAVLHQPLGPLICYKGCRHTEDTQLSKLRYITTFHNKGISDTILQSGWAGIC